MSGRPSDLWLGWRHLSVRHRFDAADRQTAEKDAVGRTEFGLRNLLDLLARGENVSEPISDSTRRQPDASSAFAARGTTTHCEDGNAVHFGVLLFGENAIEFDASRERNRLPRLLRLIGTSFRPTGHASVSHQQ
jgi:hypothetical protein